ncbi:MAG: bifunctional glutamate N-acetyltransferase/amino-acid acetyltransferase ArgJ, partial [Vicinamibacteria bacterium]
MSTGVTAARGFRAAAVEAGIKTGRTDFALLVSDRPCVASAVFTTNLAKAAPVLVSAEHLRGGTARAVLVNAGCANAATGAQGLADARESVALTAAALGCPVSEVLVCSTGVIGVNLPMDKIRAAIPVAAFGLSVDGGSAAARAIMTTDTKPKESSRRIDLGGVTVTVGGMAKGAGMIAPSLAPLHATMLAFFTTDVTIDKSLLDQALIEAVGPTFNRITVDSDTSTNDAAIILANGAAGALAINEPGPAYNVVRDALREVCRDLALMMIRDGEGVQRIAEVVVKGARSSNDALRIARTIADSPLVKTALHGGDPNWGRILAAAGRAGVPFEIDKVDIHIGDVF